MSPWLADLRPQARALLPRRAWRAATHWLGRSRPTAFIASDAVWHFNADWHAAWPAAQPHGDVPTWLQSQRGQRVDVVLSCRCSKTLLLDDAAQEVAADDIAGIEALARARLLEVWGDEAANWPVRCWGGQLVHGACAWSHPQAASWLQAAQAASVNIRSIVPWWSVVLRRAADVQPGWGCDERSALLVCEGEHVTWLLGEHAELLSLRQRRLVEPTLSAASRFAAEHSGLDGVAPERVLVVGYGLRGDVGGTFGGETVLGNLDGACPEAQCVID